jgi:poly-gamma-glutamate capsule biosynthesis protein CapA/YwtB (metallophosphatase superfamily)
MIRLFLTGDIMTGRGIDQVLPNSCDPRLHEPWIVDAGRYADLAEEAHGPIPRPVDFPYIWGIALEELERRKPDARVVNLETSITLSDDYWSGKGIHYRMHPGNLGCLSAASIDCCVLANNHVLDWGYKGLDDTLAALRAAGIAYAGAGHDSAEALEPALLDTDAAGRVLVFGLGDATSGIPRAWRAREDRAGVVLLDDTSPTTARKVAAIIRAHRKPGDVVVASIHWGDNWGYAIDSEHREFAHALIDSDAIDVVHGHSSHHPRGVEVYADKPIFYGCGDLLNDYEGIGGYEEYRSDLSLMYFVDIDQESGKLLRVDMVPARLERFRLHRSSEQEAMWLRDLMNHEGKSLNTRVALGADDCLSLQW